MNDSMNEGSTVQLQGLIDRMRQGDAKAIDLLIGQASARLQFIARKIRRDFPKLKNQEETVDVLQKGVIRLMRALRDVEISTVKEFFRLAAVQIRRELLDLARRPSVIKNSSDFGSEGIPEPDAVTHEPLRLAEWTEFHRKVEALPDQEREVVDLVWYQGMSQSEAAVVLQLSLRTVKRRWLSARLRLQAS